MGSSGRKRRDTRDGVPRRTSRNEVRIHQHVVVGYCASLLGEEVLFRSENRYFRSCGVGRSRTRRFRRGSGARWEALRAAPAQGQHAAPPSRAHRAVPRSSRRVASRSAVVAGGLEQFPGQLFGLVGILSGHGCGHPLVAALLTGVSVLTADPTGDDPGDQRLVGAVVVPQPKYSSGGNLGIAPCLSAVGTGLRYRLVLLGHGNPLSIGYAPKVVGRLIESAPPRGSAITCSWPFPT
ncbi:hypothetical protein FHR84_000487 [Actinopolyspora biskrensis]|uniref:Uncharacterized protein n=1 Tax=Actinopolyspora biskrensis TaxID=1470178 RepID=A0A852Z4I6_9ACTN|nr:hypothetical protein [Actinopolyspora biskrensis]